MIKLRELRGMKTQNYIAEKVGLRRETYRGYETGIRQADYETLIKLADYFNVSLDYLLGREQKAPAAGQELTSEENELLTKFRLCTPNSQNRILGYVELMAEQDQQLTADG